MSRRAEQNCAFRRLRLFAAWAGLLFVLKPEARGGGSGLNVAVVVNQASTNSVRLGNYYCEQRQVPPQNLLRINWAGGRTEWTPSEFTNSLLLPLRQMLTARALTNQIDYVLLSMDIPYRVKDSTGANSTTSALFYGFKRDGPNGPWYLAPGSSNSYAGSEGIFRDTPPSAGAGPFFLATMLTASNLSQAKMAVDNGTTGDGAFPTAPVVLAKSDDRLRNIRYELFEDAIFDMRLQGRPSVVRTNANSFLGLGPLLGYQNGTALFNSAPGVFVPGAMADNLTSFGGILFEPNDQTTLLAFLAAGASGSYGTVVEPANWLQKFPAPRAFFYQGRGFSLAESYYLSITNPFQGLLVGEPLVAPFARPAEGGWTGLPPGSLLTGSTNLTAVFTAVEPQHPVQTVSLFVDGLYSQTLTNLQPQPGNTITVTLNNRTVSYVVKANSFLQEAASDVAAALDARRGQTRVEAYARGDRVELRGIDFATPGGAIPLLVTATAGTAATLTAFATPSGPSLLDTTAQGMRSYTITNVPAVGDFLEMIIIKTNGDTVAVGVTNTVAGTTLAVLAKSLFGAVSNTPGLTGPDGVEVDEVNMHEDFPYNVYVYGPDDHSGEFNVRARGPGWARAGVRVCVRGSGTFRITPGGTNRLDQNLGDLQPRAHVYLTAGATNLPVTFPLNTSTLPDGYHELTVVAYEGSHVRTQRRSTQTVRIQNSPLSAALQLAQGASNNIVGTTVGLTVAAEGSAISDIELFSTGGSLGGISGQPTAGFIVDTGLLGVGLHPVYAVVTAAGGKQYRTETEWLRIVDSAAPEPPFSVSLAGPPPLLSWPAIAGRSYEILGTTNLLTPFELRDTVIPTSSPALWLAPEPLRPAEFFRVRAR